MPRLKIYLPLFLVLAVFGLVACGGGGGGGSTAPVGAAGFRVSGTFPQNGTQSFDPDGKLIVSFSESLLSVADADHNLVLFYRATGQLVARDLSLTVGGQVATMVPSPALTKDTWYSLRIRGELRSSSSRSLGQDFVLHFKTSATGPVDPPPPPPPASATLRLAGDMAVGRSSHVAELLPNGMVLVAGGFDTANSVTGTAEIFDPVQETFSRTSVDMVTPRGFHAAVALGNGNIFITGGVAGGAFAESNQAEIFNSASGTFGGTGSMFYPRAFHTMTLLKDGRVLIAGGTVPDATGSFSSRKAEIYNPANGTYSTLPDMNVYRASHTATLLPDGRVLLAGGNSTDKQGELFDPGTNSFTLVAGEMQNARRGHTATHVGDGIVMLLGGGSRTAELFVPAQDLFRSTNSFPLYDRKEHTATLTPSGRLLVTGGSYFSGNVIFFNQTTEYYLLNSGTFAPSQLVLDSPKTRHRATELGDGRILITGGSNLDASKPELKEALLYEEE